MLRRPPRSTRTDTLFPYTTLFRSISMTPAFSPTRLAWVDKGGVLAIANLRGGGEYGKAWHDAGRLDKKQNVFDDFIAAGEFMIGAGITGKRSEEGRVGTEVGRTVRYRWSQCH